LNWNFAGEGIEVALSSFRKDVVVNKVQYCGYVQLSRPIFQRDHSLIGGKFNVLTHSGQSGVTFNPSQGHWVKISTKLQNYTIKFISIYFIVQLN
jgi:hypothetical protein